MSQLPPSIQSKQITTTAISSKPSTNSIRKRIFTKELRTMMYGFGDVSNPRQDTIDTVEDCLLDFLSRFLTQASKIAKPRGGRVRTEDMLTVLKRDPRKLGRVEELLYMNEELQKVRKAYDSDE